MTGEQKAYIAGFLDGDGCIMFQLIKREDYSFGYQIRASIVFYQKTEYKTFLAWLRRKFNVGYLRDRNDGISEYTIVGFTPVEKILQLIGPFVRLKKKQVQLALEIIGQIQAKKGDLTPQLFLQLARKVDRFGQLNYSKKRKRTSVEVEEYLQSHHLLSP